MADKYEYRRLVRRHWYGKFRLRRRYAAVFLLLILITVGILVADLTRSNKSLSPTSEVENIQVGNSLNTFSSQYFEFKDTGNWVLNKQDSTNQKFVYFKYRGVQPIGQLSIYVNQEPTPLELAGSQVLPVRIVNHNRFDVTNVYGPCGSKYASGELHKVKVVTIEGADVLCDPDTPSYKVALSEVAGNWQLQMQQKNGQPITFVITFRDITVDPVPQSILRIAESFRSL